MDLEESSKLNIDVKPSDRVFDLQHEGSKSVEDKQVQWWKMNKVNMINIYKVYLKSFLKSMLIQILWRGFGVLGFWESMMKENS